jgi:hypothetical protein
LHQEAGHVERDEYEWVQVRTNTGEGRAERETDVFEGEVDGYTDEGGREDDGADLGLERVFVPWACREGDA